MPHPDPPHRPPTLPISIKNTLARRAATLYERATALTLPAADPAPDTDPDGVMELWLQAFAQGDAAAFARRLAWDGLDVESARIAAGASPATGDRLPDWTIWLDRMADEAPGVLADWLNGTLDESDPNRWTDEPPFVELWTVPLRAARARLVDGVPESARRRLTAAAQWTLERQLIREVSLWAELATLELFTARGAPATEPDGPAAPGDRYRPFITSMLEGGLADLFATFPVLARQMARIVEQWVVSTGELLERLDADVDALAATFGSGESPGRVTSLVPALSDPHHGRRRVVALTFKSGLRVVYKPRDVQLEAALGGLLAWAAGHGLDPAPSAPCVLCRDGYGWVEFLARGDQPSEEHVARYYRQGGSLLCLAYVLRGQDLHMDNVVATSGGPVLIDVELVLQPVRDSGASGPAGHDETETQPTTESCLATGLLSMFQTGPGGEAFDVGGLRGVSEQTTNRVTLGGVLQSADRHAAAILTGFDDAYRLLVRHRQELLRPAGPLAAFAGGQTRVLPRPTNQYAMLTEVLRAPRYQRDGARQSAAMDILLRPFNRLRSRPRAWPVLVAERHVLEMLDVPYFWVPGDGRDVSTGSEVVARDYFERSGLDSVRERIRSLSDADRQRQERLLARALTESPASHFVSPAPVAGSASGRLLEAAIWIARELQRITLASDGSHAAPGSCPHRLYDGTLGPALLFAALHAVTGDREWADSARATLAPVHASIDAGEIKNWIDEGIGAGDGLGSLVYGLTAASSLLGEPSLLDAAMKVAPHLPVRVDQDRHLDVLSGAAGAILALLALDERRRDSVLLDWARACGRHLVSQQMTVGDGAAWPGPGGRRIVGFAHGAAGIAFALRRLFERTGDAEFGEAARRGFRFERDRYLAGEQNWPVADIPDGDPTGRLPSMMAWCHGGPGIALANASALDDLGDGAEAEVRATLSSAARWIPARPDHLCCGTLGRSDVLLTVGRQLKRPEAVASAHALAEHVLDRAMKAGHFRLSAPGFEYRVFDAGFFRGLSGIGYVLLRLAAPDQVPSVLAFDVLPRERRVP